MRPYTYVVSLPACFIIADFPLEDRLQVTEFCNIWHLSKNSLLQKSMNP